MVLTVVDGLGMVGGWSGGSPKMARESLGDGRGDESPTDRRWLVEGGYIHCISLEGCPSIFTSLLLFFSSKAQPCHPDTCLVFPSN
jgi:hypothetical protein